MLQQVKQLQTKLSLTTIQNILFAFLIFAIPSNLFKKFLESSAFVRGLQVDYLLPKLYFSDLILIVLFLSLLYTKKNRLIIQQTLKKLLQKPILILLFTTLTIFQFTTTYPIVAIFFLLRVLILLGTGICLITNRILINSVITTTAIQITLIFQSLLAWYQYLQQKSFFGYYFFGETNINSYAGVARSSLLGVEKILPYGTTAHPNILAGIITIFSLIHLNKTLRDTKNRKINILILGLATSTLLLTQSLSAFLAFISGVVTLIVVKKYRVRISLKTILSTFIIGSIAIIVLLESLHLRPTQSYTSIARRAYLNQAALKMIAEHTITGVGLQNFTGELEKYSTNQEIVRFVQPVHNVLLLFLAEFGLVGATLVLLIIAPILKSAQKLEHPEYLAALIPIAIFDHYLFSLQSGILILSLSFMAAISQSNNSLQTKK